MRRISWQTMRRACERVRRAHGPLRAGAGAVRPTRLLAARLLEPRPADHSNRDTGQNISIAL